MFDHTHIYHAKEVINRVILYLKDIDTPSLNDIPNDDSEVPYEALTFKQKQISGLLGISSSLDISIPVNINDLVPIGSNAGPNLQLNSIKQATLQGTTSSPESMFTALLEWDDGDVNMTLTSPSGIEYSYPIQI